MVAVDHGQRILVGKNSEMNFAEITSKYVGAPFRIGGQSRAEGFDCWTVCFCIARDLGKDPPEVMGELTLDNYSALYESDEQAAIDAMIQYCEKNLTEIPPTQAFVGDLMIMKDNKGSRFAALHAGNDFIISSFENLGVSIAKLRTFKTDRVFKWEKSY